MRCIIVVPCYNEADRLPVGAFKSFSCLEYSLKFLFVNDGSTDDTLNMLGSLCETNLEKFECLDVPHSGKAEAVRKGILHALDSNPEYVGFWDADLATPLKPILDFCDLLDENSNLEMVFGSRVKLLGREIERLAIRHYLGRWFATAVSIMLKLPIYDTQCGAKIFRNSPEVCRLFENPFRTSWIFDVEILARMRQRGKLIAKDVIYEFPLMKWCDVKGSKVKPWDFAKAFLELIRIYCLYLRP